MRTLILLFLATLAAVALATAYEVEGEDMYDPTGGSVQGGGK